MESLIILGSGPAGLTAAIYAARAGLSPLVVTGSLPGGLPTQLSAIENYPGFPQPKNAFELAEDMRQQAENLGARLHYGIATELRLQPHGPHTVRLDDGSELTCKALIVAVGSRHLELGLASEKALQNRGVSYCAVCDGALFRGQDVAVAGGAGHAPLIQTPHLAPPSPRVHLVCRHETLRGTPALRQRILDNPAIILHLNCAIAEIQDIRLGKVTAIVIRHKDSGERETVPCAAVFVAVGQAPNTAMLQGQLDLDPQGHIRLTSPHGTETSVPGVFAAGDCADPTYKQVVTAAATGCMAALDAIRSLADKG